MDYSRPGSMIILDQGERYEPGKARLDPSILTGLETAETKAEQSTIYRQDQVSRWAQTRRSPWRVCSPRLGGSP